MATVDKRQEEHVSFGRLGLDEWLVNQCKTMGLSKPTEIQQNCIPRILKGKVKWVSSNDICIDNFGQNLKNLKETHFNLRKWYTYLHLVLKPVLEDLVHESRRDDFILTAFEYRRHSTND